VINSANALFFSLSLHQEEAEEDRGKSQEECQHVQQTEPREEVGAEALREGEKERMKERERERESRRTRMM